MYYHLSTWLTCVSSVIGRVRRRKHRFVSKSEKVETSEIVPESRKKTYRDIREDLTVPHASVFITEINAKNVPKLKWDGENDSYCILQSSTFTWKTPTKWSGGSSPTWTNLRYHGVLKRSDDDAPVKLIQVDILNEYLAREDQLIGRGTVARRS